jgi:hypothetical protein
VEKIKKLPYAHPHLALMFSLVEWLATNWPILTNEPNLVDGMPTAIAKLKRESLDAILADFVEPFKYDLPGGEERMRQLKTTGTHVNTNEENKQEKRHNYIQQHGINSLDTKQMSVWTNMEKLFNEVI